MNLKEYLNQEEPVRMPKVRLEKEDYKLILTYKAGGEIRRRIEINEYCGVEYVQVGTWENLYTTDSDGNPKNRSCFWVNNEHFKIEEQPKLF